MRFFLNLNLTGHECYRCAEMGRPNAPDDVICDHARENGFVLITDDLDLPVLLAHSSDQKPSVILLRGEPLVPELRGSALLERSRTPRTKWTPAPSSASTGSTKFERAF